MSGRFKVGRAVFFSSVLLLIIGFFICNPVEAKYGVYPENISWAYGDDTVSIPIYVDDIGGLESWDLIIKYDTGVLTFLNVEYTDLSAQYYLINANFDPDAEGIKVGAIQYFDNAGVVPPPPDGTGGALFNAVFQVTDQVPAATDIAIVIIPDTGPQLQAIGSSGVFYGESVHYDVSFLEKYIDMLEGNSFYISLYINSTKDLQYWNLELVYNPDILQFKDYISLTSLTDQYDNLKFYEETPGLVKVSAIKLDKAMEGSGVFLRFFFQAKNKGASDISLQYINDKGNQFGPVTASTGRVWVNKPTTVTSAVPAYWTYPKFSTYPVNLIYPTFSTNLRFPIYMPYSVYPGSLSYISYPTIYSMFQRFYGLPSYSFLSQQYLYQNYNPFRFGGINPFWYFR
ncbi:hypothetical protein JXL19_03505 [bacterium]|nr:hypothetical protein [bacterium]